MTKLFKGQDPPSQLNVSYSAEPDVEDNYRKSVMCFYNEYPGQLLTNSFYNTWSPLTGDYAPRAPSYDETTTPVEPSWNNE